jgi:hypothetical protein
VKFPRSFLLNYAVCSSSLFFNVSAKRFSPEVNRRNIDDLRALCSEFGVEELLAALEAFDAAPPILMFRRSTTNPAGAFTMLKRKTCKLTAMLLYCSRKLAICSGRIRAFQPKTAYRSKKCTRFTNDATD